MTYIDYMNDFRDITKDKLVKGNYWILCSDDVENELLIKEDGNYYLESDYVYDDINDSCIIECRLKEDDDAEIMLEYDKEWNHYILSWILTLDKKTCRLLSQTADLISTVSSYNVEMTQDDPIMIDISTKISPENLRNEIIKICSFSEEIKPFIDEALSIIDYRNIYSCGYELLPGLKAYLSERSPIIKWFEILKEEYHDFEVSVSKSLNNEMDIFISNDDVDIIISGEPSKVSVAIFSSLFANSIQEANEVIKSLSYEGVTIADPTVEPDYMEALWETTLSFDDLEFQAFYQEGLTDKIDFSDIDHAFCDYIIFLSETLHDDILELQCVV